MRRTEHQVLESEASAPRARAVFKITCPRRQISPPVRKAFAIFSGRLWVGVSCLTYCSYFFFVDILHMENPFVRW